MKKLTSCLLVAGLLLLTSGCRRDPEHSPLVPQAKSGEAKSATPSSGSPVKTPSPPANAPGK